jgi:Protein of unknown function (DUF2808)
LIRIVNTPTRFPNRSSILKKVGISQEFPSPKEKEIMIRIEAKTDAIFATSLAAFLLGSAIALPPTQAVQLADGTVYFVQPPSLVNVRTTEDRTAVRGATYYFTVSIPEEAGEPLQRIAIAQEDGDHFTRQVEFNVEESRTFVGTPRRQGEGLTSVTTYDETSQTLSVTFDPPINPGTTLTIGLRPERNPLTDTVYLFGVTAFPAGEIAHGQFLGFGRLHFYRARDFFF